MVIALCAAGSADAAYRGDAGSAKLKPAGRILVRLPKPGHVSFTVVKLRLKGHAAAVAPKRLKLALGNARRFRTAQILAAVKSRKTRTGATYTIILVVLNGRRLRTLAGPAGASADLERPVGGVTFVDPWSEFTLLVTGKTVDQIENEDLKDANMRALAALAESRARAEAEDVLDLPPVWNPVAKPTALNEPGVETGHYDDGHSLGWKKADKAWWAPAAELISEPLSAPAATIEADTQKLYEVAGVAFPGGPTCAFALGACALRFGFGGLHMSWQEPPDNNGARGSDVFDVSGTACGADPLSANWAIATSGAGLPPQTLNNVFRFTNPYPVLDWAWAGSKNSQPAELQGKLRLTSGAAPKMTLEATTLGPGAAAIGGLTVSPSQAPVTATPVSGCS